MKKTTQTPGTRFLPLFSAYMVFISFCGCNNGESDPSTECFTNDDCGGRICVNGVCSDLCITADDCEPGHICLNGECRNLCVTAEDCASNENCVNGVCSTVCLGNDDCDPGQTCIDGTCSDSCMTESDCDLDQVCLDGSCVHHGLFWLRAMDFETGDFSQQGGGDQGSGDVSIVTDIVHRGNFAVKTRAPVPDPEHPDDRDLWESQSCLRIWGGNPMILDWTEYPETYWSFWIYVEPGFEVPQGPAWQLFSEWCAPHPRSCSEHVGLLFMNTGNDVTNNVILQFFDDQGIFLYDWGLPVDPGTFVYEIHSDVELPTGHWVYFEVFYKASLTEGVITVEMDGLEILRWEGRTQFEPRDNTRMSFLAGNYCDRTLLDPHDIYLDDLYIWPARY